MHMHAGTLEREHIDPRFKTGFALLRGLHRGTTKMPHAIELWYHLELQMVPKTTSKYKQQQSFCIFLNSWCKARGKLKPHVWATWRSLPLQNEIEEECRTMNAAALLLLWKGFVVYKSVQLSNSHRQQCWASLKTWRFTQYVGLGWSYSSACMYTLAEFCNSLARIQAL